MFVSVHQPRHERASITAYLSASQHCKHFGLPGGAVAVRSSVNGYPSREPFSKLCHPHNFRVRKLKTVHRTLGWNSKNASKLTVTTADIDVFFQLLGNPATCELTVAEHGRFTHRDLIYIEMPCLC